MSEERAVDGEVAMETVGEELGLVREVVLRAYPDAVPELITGGSVAALLAAVEPARTAYARIAESVAGAAPAPSAPPPVPAGAVAAAVDPATLPAHELIRRGVGGRRTSRG